MLFFNYRFCCKAKQSFYNNQNMQDGKEVAPTNIMLFHLII